MATPATLTWLETYGQAGAALSFVIEGFETAFATDSMPSTYSADSTPYSNWSNPTGGLIARGTIGQEIQLYAQDIEANTLEFTVTDATGALATMFREGYALGHKTYLTSNVVSGSTSALAVKDTTGFAASGTVYIGDERLTYTTTTATTFAGTIGRGKFAINQTDGGTGFSSSHIIGNNVTKSAVTTPAVSDYPRTWYGRFCHLFLHVKDPLTGLYNLPSVAYKAFTGRIVSYRDEGDGRITVVAKSAIELLNRAVGSEQWTARFNEGVTLTSAMDTVGVSNSQATAYIAVASLGFDGERYTHADVAGAIGSQFEAWRAAGTGSGGTRSGDLWGIELIDPGDGSAFRYRIALHANSTAVTTGTAAIAMHPEVWNLLGWEDSSGIEGNNPTTGDWVALRALSKKETDGSVWETVAPKPPVVYYKHNLMTNDEFEASSQVGTFVTETVSDMGHEFISSETNGVVQMDGSIFGGAVYAVKFTAGSPTARVRVYGKLNPQTGKFDVSGDTEQFGYVRLGDAQEAPSLKQVWFEHGRAGDILLRTMLSTGGSSGYNHATYDTYTTPGFGIGIPASLIDTGSFASLNDVAMMFLITEPKPFYEFLEPVLQCTNRYVVWKAADASSQPKLTIIRPQIDNSVQTTWTMNESNKCRGKDGPDRIRVERAADGIINRVVVKFGHGIDGSDTNARKWIVEDIASQSDYGRRRTVNIEAPGIVNVESLAPAAIAPALAYFSRPLAVIERSFNASLLRMAPGDSVTLTDNYMIDPQTGTRGATVYAWVLGTQFDLATGQGVARIVHLPEKVPRVKLWAPSAKVSSYDAGTRTFTVAAHEFSHSSDTVTDAKRFSNNDVVHIYSLDESSPLEWSRTVSGTPGNTSVVISVALSSPAYDAAKSYVIEYDDIASVQASQITSAAYIADDATLSTGGSPTTPCDWGSGLTQLFTTAPVYSYGMFQPNGAEDNQGEPLSAHKAMYLARAANNLHSYKTRGVHINNYLETAGTQTGTTPKLVYIGYCPYYGHVSDRGSRPLVARLYGKTSSGTATFKIRISALRPTGTSFTSYTFPVASYEGTFSTTSTTYAWSTEMALTCPVLPTLADMLPGFWVTVDAQGSGGGVTASLSGVFVAEDALT